MFNRLVCILGLAAMTAFYSPLRAAGDKEKGDDKAPGKNGEEAENIVTTRHSVSIGGKKLDYTATAGFIPILEDGGKEDGKAVAQVFYIAYTRENAGPNRPVLFSFNGGPGSSSVWLHLGVFGPRRVLLEDDGMAPAPPHKVVPNAYSILDKTDLVFIDPVSTGLSRAAKDENPSQFHGVSEDVNSVGEFIRLYVTRNARWGSPKFLAGESYGTTRAAGLASHMQQKHGMDFNGIILVSSVLEFQTISFADGNDTPYPLFLPSYTATAWHHGKLDEELQADFGKAIREAENFAINEYLPALARGHLLAPALRSSVVERLARFTGLSKDYIERSNLRVPLYRFTKELLRDQRRTVGRMDSRYLGIDSDSAGDSYEYDPSLSALIPPYTGAFNHYLRTELEYESDRKYEILSSRVHPWNYGGYKNRYLNVADSLRKAMTLNPHLKVYVASGYFDMATPYFAADYTFNRLGLDPSLQNNVTIEYYQGGHMMYVNLPDLKKMKKDLDAFIDAALPAGN